MNKTKQLAYRAVGVDFEGDGRRVEDITPWVASFSEACAERDKMVACEIAYDEVVVQAKVVTQTIFSFERTIV